MKRILFLTLLITSLFAQGQNAPNATIYNGEYTSADNHYLNTWLNGSLRRIQIYRIGQTRADSLAVAMATYAKLQRMLDSLSAIRTALEGKQASGDYATNSALTALGATKADLVGGRVPADQLPSYVSEVQEYTNLAAFPGTGTAGIIYVDTTSDLTYRWSGSQYTQISPSDVSSVAGKTGAVTLVKGDVGLGNVQNVDQTNPANITQSSAYRFTNDTEKSTWNGKQDALGFTPVPNTRTVNGKALSANITLNKADFSDLNNVDNTSDANKPVSTATQTALDSKQNTLVSGTNIKTINGNSILGAGDLAIAGGNGDVTNSTISGLRALVSASSAIRYYITDAGKEGLFYYDALDNTSADDSALVIVTTDGTSKRFKRVIQNNTVYLKWFTDAFNYSPILSKLWNAGYHVEGEYGATYPLTSVISLTDKNVSFNGNGCRFELNYNAAASQWLDLLSTPIYQTGTTPWTVEAISGVNSASTSTGNNLFTNIGLGGTHGSSYLQLAGNQTSSLARGDIIRLYSDDNLVTGFTDLLKAEFLVIEQIAYDATSNKTRVAFQGQTMYEYTVGASNTKLVKMPKYRFLMENFTFVHTSAGTVKFCELRGIYNPIIRNVTLENFKLSTIDLIGTYGANIENLIISNVENDPPQGFAENGADAGYGINCNADFGTTVSNSKFYNIRHAFTTTYGAQTSSTHPWQRGETQSATVSTSIADGCAHAWDTHESGVNITFSNLLTQGSTAAYQIRARGVSVTGGRVRRSGTAVYFDLGDFASDPMQEPVVVDGLTVEKQQGNTATVIKSAPASGTSRVPIIIKNCKLSGGDIWIDNQKRTDIINCQISTKTEYGYTENSRWLTVDDGSEVHVHNCKVETGSGTIYGIVFQGGSSANKVYIDGLTVQTNDANPTLINPTSATSNIFVAKNVVFLGANGPSNTTETTLGPVVSNAVSGFSVLRMQWKTESLSTSVSSRNSKFMTHSTNGSTLTINTYGPYLLDETVYVKWQGTSASTVTTIANGSFLGQEMVIHNGSANNVNLQLPTLNGVAKTLSQHQAARLVYSATGVWSYQ